MTTESGERPGDRSGLAIGGGLLVGLGVGFFFLPASALAFVGCIVAGLGLGLVLAFLMPGRARR